MIDRTKRDEAGLRPDHEAALRMPLQAPPINRTASVTAGAVGDSAGVQANGIFDNFNTRESLLSLIPV
ncbi:hypothetical protein ABZ153_39380 [Streptomyces sp. NPDC006290]|uniref:hypothetical protein n=1 Tax=Streptomyces sp. NPDC006290 TaxID=3156745 RepID=UPI0033B1E5C3